MLTSRHEEEREAKTEREGGKKWRKGWREQRDAAQPAGGVFDEV